jgi:predicted RNase H-like HicB family nuclease
MNAMRTLKVRFERDASGWWIVTIPEIQGCRTQGRSIAEGRRRIREALELFLSKSEAERARFIDDVRLAAEASRTVQGVAAVRRRSDALRARVQEETRAAVDLLTRKAGLSVRDAAEVLGISHQRVQQLVGGR